MIQQGYFLKELESFRNMIDSGNLFQELIDLSKRMEDLDRRLKDVQIEVHNMLWDFAKLNIEKNKMNKILFYSRTATNVNKNNDSR